MARDIQDLTNTDAPSLDYPYGRVRDISSPGASDGTPVNEEMVGDVLQFFNKLMAEGGVTANGLPDNDYSGFQFFEALETFIQNKIDDYPSEVYMFKISQSGTSAPTVTGLGSNPSTPTPSRLSTGRYILDFGAVIGDAIILTGTEADEGQQYIVAIGGVIGGTTTEQIVISTYDGGVLTDGLLSDFTLQVKRNFV